MTALVEHILDDADVLVGGKTRADRDNITEVLFTIAWLTFPSLPLSAVSECLIGPILSLIIVGSAILATTLAISSLAPSWLCLLRIIGLWTCGLVSCRLGMMFLLGFCLLGLVGRLHVKFSVKC